MGPKLCCRDFSLEVIRVSGVSVAISKALLKKNDHLDWIVILVVSEGMEPGDGGMDTRERSSSDGVLQEGTIQPSLSLL